VSTIGIHQGRVLNALRTKQIDERDYYMRIPTGVELASTPDIVDNKRSLPTAIWDQLKEGACVGFTVALMTEQWVVRVLRMRPPQRVSPRLPYWLGRGYAGDQKKDTGTTVNAACKGTYKAGYVFEPTFPYFEDCYPVAPSKAVLAEAAKHKIPGYYRVTQQQEAIEAALAGGAVIGFGMDAYDGLFKPNKKTGVVDPAKGQLRGGHAIALVGYNRKTRMFEFRNSWGDGYGLKGYGKLPYAWVLDREHCGDFQVIGGAA
jgi:C1A family cysteine protease